MPYVGEISKSYTTRERGNHRETLLKQGLPVYMRFKTKEDAQRWQEVMQRTTGVKIDIGEVYTSSITL